MHRFVLAVVAIGTDASQWMHPNRATNHLREMAAGGSLMRHATGQFPEYIYPQHNYVCLESLDLIVGPTAKVISTIHNWRSLSDSRGLISRCYVGIPAHMGTKRPCS